MFPLFIIFSGEINQSLLTINVDRDLGLLVDVDPGFSLIRGENDSVIFIQLPLHFQDLLNVVSILNVRSRRMIDTNILDSLSFGKLIFIPSLPEVMLSLVLVLNVIKVVTIILLRQLENNLALFLGLLVIRVDQHILMLISHVVVLPLLTLLVSLELTVDYWGIYLVSLNDNLLVFVLQERPGLFIVNVESLASIVGHSLLGDMLIHLHLPLEPVRTLW